MKDPSEQVAKQPSAIEHRNKQYQALYERGSRVIVISNQSHQNFLRLLFTLSKDGEKKFLALGNYFLELFENAIKDIIETPVKCTGDNLPEIIEQTVSRLESEAKKAREANEVIEAKSRSLTEIPTKVMHKQSQTTPEITPSSAMVTAQAEKPVRERPKSAPVNHRWNVSSPRSNRSSKSTTPSPRSTESSPRKSILSLFSPRRRNDKQSSSTSNGLSSSLK